MTEQMALYGESTLLARNGVESLCLLASKQTLGQIPLGHYIFLHL